MHIDFLLQVLKDNNTYYYDAEGNCYTEYSGLQGIIKELKTKIAVRMLLKNDPNRLLQFVHEIWYTDRITTFLAYNIINIIQDSVFSFKKVLNNSDPRLFGATIVSYGFYDDKYMKMIQKKASKDRSFAIEMCKGIIEHNINMDKFLEHKSRRILNVFLQELEKINGKENINYSTLCYLLAQKRYRSVLYVLMDTLCQNDQERKEMVLKICDEYIKDDSRYTKYFELLKRKIEKGIITPEIFGNFFNPGCHVHESAINSYLLCNSFALSKISIAKQKEINIKELNNLIKIAKARYPSNNNSILYTDFIYGTVILNMLISLGFQNAKDLLEGKYGYVSSSMLINAFNRIDLDEYNLNNKQVIRTEYQNAMISFLFGNGTTAEEHNIKKILSGEAGVNLAVLIGNWKLLYYISGGKVKLKDINRLLDDLSPMLKDYQQVLSPVIKKAGTDMLPKILEAFELMCQRSESTIPKVEGMVEDFEYEVLDLDSANQMYVGYDTVCCFTFEGASSDALFDALTSKTSRIMVIRKNGKIVAQSWIWRNGNVLCFDDIEKVGVSRKNDPIFVEICREAAKKILEVSAGSEEAEEKIEICTIGVSPNDTGVGRRTVESVSKKLEREETLCPIPNNGNDSIYTDASTQFVLAKSQSYEHSKSFIPTVRYQDKRVEITVCDPQQSSKETVQLADLAIHKIDDFSKSNTQNYASDFSFVAYGKDWYIGITPNGTIVERKYGTDERKDSEIKDTYQKIRDKAKSGELKVILTDIDTSYGKGEEKGGTKK